MQKNKLPGQNVLSETSYMKCKPSFILLATTTFALLLSCSSPSTNLLVLSAIDSTLIRSGHSIQRSNADVLMAFQNKLADPKTVEKAKAWQPKVVLIDVATQSLIRFADSLIAALKSKPESVRKIFIEQDVADELSDKLRRYKQQLMAIHERINEVSFPYADTVATNTPAVMSLKKLFTNATQQEAISILLSLQNDLLRTENWALLVCLDQTAILDHPIFHSYEAIVGQNSKVLKAGDDLEITAGIGSFSRNAKPKISVGGKEANLNERGYAVYRFKTSRRLGKYSLPVTIEFTDDDGQRQTRTFTIEYRLVNE